MPTTLPLGASARVAASSSSVSRQPPTVGTHRGLMGWGPKVGTSAGSGVGLLAGIAVGLSVASRFVGTTVALVVGDCVTIPLVGTADGRGAMGAKEVGAAVGWGRGSGAFKLVGAEVTVATIDGPRVDVASEFGLNEALGEIVGEIGGVGSIVADISVGSIAGAFVFSNIFLLLLLLLVRFPFALLLLLPLLFAPFPCPVPDVVFDELSLNL